MREGNHMAGTLKLVAKYGLDTVMRWVVEDREPHQFSSEELKAKIEDFRLRSDELAQTKRR
jgi:hypothetical protein